MEQKIKFIIIGLIVILVISFALNILTISSKQALMRQRDTLKEEKTSLLKQAEEIRQDFQKKITVLNANLERLTQENEGIQKKLELVERARGELVEQLNALKKEKESAQSTTSGPLATDVYWAAILKQKKDLEWRLDKLGSELKTEQINNEQLEKEKGNLELEARNLNRDKEDLLRQYEFVRKQLEYNKKMMDTLALELVGEKNDKLQIQETFKAIKSENTILRRQLKSLNDRKINLERKLAEAEGKNKDLENRFTEMDILLKDKELQLDKLNKALTPTESGEPVELSPIVVRPQSEVPNLTTVLSGAAAEGKVVAINRENNFVIIDLGEDQSARVGDVFQVYNKENNPIGTIEIIEARKLISACDIQKESSPIKVGDKVKIR